MRTAWKGNGYGLHIERIRDEDCMERIRDEDCMEGEWIWTAHRKDKG